jgi:hypothetical protein
MIIHVLNTHCRCGLRFIVCIGMVVAWGLIGCGSSGTYYVAPDGDDAGPGTEARPFATLARARNAVRDNLEVNNLQMTVLVREGTYYFDEALVFGPEDSGTQDAPVTYAAYPGEEPVISGGREIVADWTPFRDGIMVCSLPHGDGNNPDFTQLFIDGKRQIRARFPDYDPSDPGMSGYLTAAGADNESPRRVYYDPDTFTKKTWKKPHEAVIHIFPENYYGNTQWTVTGIDRETHELTLGTGGWQIRSNGLGEKSRYYIENVFEELDTPGEWYLDRENGKLYCYPPAGVDIGAAQVEVAILPQVVDFKGTEDSPVQWITISGFRIAHTATTFMAQYEHPSRGDWNIHRGGAVYLENAEDIHVTNCFFDAVGGNGVFVNYHARRIDVSNNTFIEAGESAVCLVGESHLDLDGTYTCPFCGNEHNYDYDEPSDRYPAECTVSNNLIHDIGVFGKQTAGVYLSLGMKHTVSHNHIYNVPRAGICLGDCSWGGHVFEFNDVHDTVRETGDHGPFNSWGRGPWWCRAQGHGPESHPIGNLDEEPLYETIIRNNRFQDTKGWGIDLDDGSSRYHVYNNLCIGVSIKLREGDYRLVENNIFVNPANPPGIHVGYENNHDRYLRNIVVVNTAFDNTENDANFTAGESGGDLYKFVFPPLKGRLLEECDYNVFLNNTGAFSVTVTPRGSARWWADGKQYTLPEWQAMGYDEHSVYADPMFVDPDNGDYSVRPESPAIELGFKNFPMDQFGLIGNE